MILGEVLRDLAASGNDLPREAMQPALGHWDETGPRLVALLDAARSRGPSPIRCAGPGATTLARAAAARSTGGVVSREREAGASARLEPLP